MNARLALLVAILPATVLTAAPAHAVPVALEIHGEGRYYPGYTTHPTLQSMTLTGTATDVVTGAVHACAWDLVGLADTLAQGVGTWRGTCGPYTFTACTFARTGANATVACPSGWAGQLVWVVDVTTAARFTVDGWIATP